MEKFIENHRKKLTEAFLGDMKRHWSSSPQNFHQTLQ